MFDTKVNLGSYLNDIVFVRELSIYFEGREKQINGSYIYFKRTEEDEVWFFQDRGFWMEENL